MKEALPLALSVACVFCAACCAQLGCDDDCCGDAAVVAVCHSLFPSPEPAPLLLHHSLEQKYYFKLNTFAF
jgi:hypothetical protein